MPLARFFIAATASRLTIMITRAYSTQILPFYLFHILLNVFLNVRSILPPATFYLGLTERQDTGHKVISLPAKEILEDRATRHYVVELS